MRNPQEHPTCELTGYFPGVIGKVTELHAVYYSENWGFDLSFETQVGRELSEFLSRFDARKDGFWAALCNRDFAGAVAIDGGQPEGARLRWFIVRPDLQGSGIGTVLIRKAVDFCRSAGHKNIYLWTFKGLDQARTLYERAGFVLTEEHEIEQWGNTIDEQKFELGL
ncbi:MAG TPA: GNAT family N-acetyltransferase [Desulfomonilaceae bacterium]|nr:GNAT family N-acetyltransferase [Desulfomonilaceae bacterium]